MYLRNLWYCGGGLLLIGALGMLTGSELLAVGITSVSEDVADAVKGGQFTCVKRKWVPDSACKNDTKGGAKCTKRGSYQTDATGTKNKVESFVVCYECGDNCGAAFTTVIGCGSSN